jgi:hypothetical protein
VEIDGMLPPASAFKVVNICDRTELEISDCLAPFATCAVVVEPVHLSESWVGMFTSGGWGVNAGVLDSYGRWFDEALVEISLIGKYWIIEVSYPFSTYRCPPKLLGFGCGLSVTRNPMAAVQLAKACMNCRGPLSPFHWGRYRNVVLSGMTSITTCATEREARFFI